ncbi:hypothetical protein SOASR030_21920 [Leminorella grimontii]|uniref:DUF1449 family protein n=1 Tax=Leminorella grimontii TaxID=82981 RepID=A0AAV5N281_9GAMM|nr:ubiquinone biosynthesis protein UbiH [Leminorella grimontii]KFC96935.1 hypothetical protein GLGR_0937 [Leminorella grimontii ATCC 33999 = DSM 5078]GKX56080.1 hypothetical protein SOASR030_21920 [Leminorella grimontii]VFS57871.1 Uncharacterised protein [Leminorella grimontii]
MAVFLQNCLTFPAIIFSGLLVLTLLYWISASFGLMDADILNVDTPDVDIDGADLSGLAGWLAKFGLAGIPITIILSFFSFIGWFMSYFSVHWFLRFIDTDLIRYPLGVVVLVVVSFVALLITAFILKPFRPILAKTNVEKSVKNLIGKVAKVRSDSVTERRGEALMEDGGAGLILQIRAAEDAGLKRGDLVVIISYSAATHSYDVVSEEEFNRL